MTNIISLELGGYEAGSLLRLWRQQPPVIKGKEGIGNMAKERR